MRLRAKWPAAAMILALAACGNDRPDEPAQPVAAPPPSTSTTAPTTASAPSSPAPVDCVTSTLRGMSPAERAGQLLMIGTPVSSPTAIDERVADYHLGGVFLRGRTTERAARLRTEIADVRKHAEVPLLISLDQEGGSVQTLKGRDFPIIPSAERLGGGSTAKLRDTTADSARRLAAIGVTLNLAPVADTVPAALGRDNPPIGFFRRQYSSDPAKVAEDIRTTVKASQDAGVLTTIKHFPGLGRVRVNTDTDTGATDGTATAADPYLDPFAAGIEAGTAAVMISSAKYPRLDDRAIAAFSKPIITGLLRDRLGFDGLVISDDLGAAKAASDTPVGQRAVRFVAAGGDMVLSIQPEDSGAMVKALMDKAEKDQSFRVRVDEAATSVLRTKERAGLLKC